MKIIEITPGVRSVIKDMEAGAKIHVTRNGDKPDTYGIEGGGDHRADVLASAFDALFRAGLLQEVDKGLFEGCGQTFVVIR